MSSSKNYLEKYLNSSTESLSSETSSYKNFTVLNFNNIKKNNKSNISATSSATIHSVGGFSDTSDNMQQVDSSVTSPGTVQSIDNLSATSDNMQQVDSSVTSPGTVQSIDNLSATSDNMESQLKTISISPDMPKINLSETESELQLNTEELIRRLKNAV